MVVLLIWIYIWYFDYVIRCGPYPQVPVRLLKKIKKKNHVKSPSIRSRTLNSVRIRQSGQTGNRGVTPRQPRTIGVSAWHERKKKEKWL